MTELLTISVDSRLDAVRRQLAHFHSTHVALDVPAGWNELNNAARMRLVQRQAQAQRCELAVITHDEATTRAAAAIGVPIFLNSEAALYGRWRMNPTLPTVDARRPSAGLPEPPPWRRDDVVKREARPTLHKARQERIAVEVRARRPLPGWLNWVSYAALAGLLMLVLALFTLYVLPAATVTLKPGREPISVTTRIVANPDIDESDIESNQIAGRLIETIVEEVGTAATSGSTQKPTERASGAVLFSNLGAASVRIPAGTIVNTSTGAPVNFRTTVDADLAGGVGQRVSVPIEALEPGIDGNVRANTIANVDGPMRFRVRVSNPNGTYGGGSSLVRTVTQADKDKLLDEVLGRVKARAGDVLRQKLKPGEWLPDESLQTYVVAQAFDQYNDDQADQLVLTLRILAQGVAVNEEETRSLLLAAVETQIPERGKLVADSLQAARLPGAVAIGRGVEFTVTVTAQYVIPVDPTEVRSAIAGLSEARAAQALQSRWMLEAAPEFYRDPRWLGTLPALPSRIQVRVDYGDGAVQ